MTISERIEAGRRERRVLTRVSRAAWRLEQAERERTWALVSARAEGISIRTLATAAGLSPSRVHQIVAAADLDALDAALGELRAAGWPAPEDPDSGEDTELDGRDNIADRLSDEVGWLRQCADWLAHLDADSYPPAVNLRPAADWPDRAVVAVDLARVRGGHRPHRRRRGRTRPGPAGPGPDHRRGAARPAGGTPPAAGRAGPGVPGLLHPQGDCPPHRPRNWSGPGTPGRPSDTSAARSASGPATPTTRSGRANDHPCHSAHQGVQETGRCSGADGSIVTGTPSPGPPRASGARAVTRPGKCRSPRGLTCETCRAAHVVDRQERPPGQARAHPAHASRLAFNSAPILPDPNLPK